MPPQPLTSAFPKNPPVKFQLLDDAMQQRPRLAALVARVLNIWSYTDHTIATLTTNFLRTDFETVTAMLQALTGDSSRKAVIEAAAQSALSANDLELFKAVMKVIQSSRNRRNDFAHHLWGILPNEPDVLLLLDPKYLAQHHAESMAWSQDFFKKVVGEDPPSPPEINLSKVYVFRTRDLEEDVANASAAHELVFLLRMTLSPHHPAAAHTRTELLNRPVIQQALESQSSKSAQ